MKWQISESVLAWPGRLETRLKEHAGKMVLSDVVGIGLALDKAAYLLHKKTSKEDAETATSILQSVERALQHFEENL